MEMSKSEQIRAGLQKSFQSGTSSKASTVCYGYKVTQSGELVINSAEAKVVTFIFRQFISGNSLGKISDALACMGISSPTGKATWSRETISKLLNNEKYVGDVVLGKTIVIDGIQVKSHDTSKRVLMRAHTLQSSLMSSFMPFNSKNKSGAETELLSDKWLGDKNCGHCQRDTISKERIIFEEGGSLLLC